VWVEGKGGREFMDNAKEALPTNSQPSNNNNEIFFFMALSARKAVF